ncbi:MAG: SDR family NAD(P)-dependent oxidoreductase [Betaproteobacteria bacterium]
MRAAIVTGVSRGLGEALAHTLLAGGYSVLGIGRSSGTRLAGPNYRFVEIDLADPSTIDHVLEATFAQMAAARPEFVCLINNAAVGTPVGVLGTQSAEEIARSLAVNLAAPAALANLFCRTFADESTERRIINVSSGAAGNAMPGMSSYCIAKAGMEMLTRALAAERHGDRFRAITVRPGIIDTGMQEQMRSLPKEVLPGVALFEGFHKSGQLVPADITAGVVVAKLVVEPVDNGRTYTYQELTA